MPGALAPAPSAPLTPPRLPPVSPPSHSASLSEQPSSPTDRYGYKQSHLHTFEALQYVNVQATRPTPDITRGTAKLRAFHRKKFVEWRYIVPLFMAIPN